MRRCGDVEMRRCGDAGVIRHTPVVDLHPALCRVAEPLEIEEGVPESESEDANLTVIVRAAMVHRRRNDASVTV